MPRLLFPAYATVSTPWKAEHNLAVAHPRMPGERAIIAQAKALEATITAVSDDDGHVSPYEYEHLIEPLASVLREQLNQDRGNLDGGRVDGWVVESVEAAGWDLDTNKPVTTEG